MQDAEGARALYGSAEALNSTRPRPCTHMWNRNEPWSWTGPANWNDVRRTVVGTLATCLEAPCICQFEGTGRDHSVYSRWWEFLSTPAAHTPQHKGENNGGKATDDTTSDTTLGAGAQRRARFLLGDVADVLRRTV